MGAPPGRSSCSSSSSSTSQANFRRPTLHLCQPTLCHLQPTIPLPTPITRMQGLLLCSLLASVSAQCVLRLNLYTRLPCSFLSKRLSFCLFLFLSLRPSLLSSQTILSRNGGKKFDVAEGEVVGIKSGKVRVCEAGKLANKPEEEVPKPYTIGCGGQCNL